MVQKDLVYNPARDIARVEIDGFVDLVKANANNAIPANLSAADLQYNEIDDPRSIAGRPRNQFEAAQMAKAIVDYKPKANAE